MAACQRVARVLAITWRTERRSRESTGQTSEARPLLATSSTQRGCVSQTISPLAKDARRAATAGKVCTMSPREPRRTTRKRASDMWALSDGFAELARGVIFGIANDGYSNAQTAGGFTLRDSIQRVIRALSVNVGMELFEQGRNVGLRKEHHIVDAPQGGNQLRAGLFIENGTARAFQRAGASVGIDADDEDIAFLFGSRE